jgi:hypothetical protein
MDSSENFEDCIDYSDDTENFGESIFENLLSGNQEVPAPVAKKGEAGKLSPMEAAQLLSSEEEELRLWEQNQSSTESAAVQQRRHALRVSKELREQDEEEARLLREEQQTGKRKRGASKEVALSTPLDEAVGRELRSSKGVWKRLPLP